MKLFSTNPEYGRNRSDLDRDIDNVWAETTKRKVNGLDTEDQDARTANLKEARGRLQ